MTKKQNQQHCWHRWNIRRTRGKGKTAPPVIPCPTHFLIMEHKITEYILQPNTAYQLPLPMGCHWDIYSLLLSLYFSLLSTGFCSLREDIMQTSNNTYSLSAMSNVSPAATEHHPYGFANSMADSESIAATRTHWHLLLAICWITFNGTSTLATSVEANWMKWLVPWTSHQWHMAITKIMHQCHWSDISMSHWYINDAPISCHWCTSIKMSIHGWIVK